MEEQTLWADLNRDGRRLEGVLKMLNTKIHKESKRENSNEGLILAYANTLAKITHEKVGIARIVLGIDELIKDVKIDESNQWKTLSVESR